mgnify:CR=1 FL=1
MSSVIRGSDNFDSSSNKLGIWRSSQLSWAAGGTYTTSHSLGVVPSSIMFEMVCIGAQNGYSVGDVAVIHSNERYSNWGLHVIHNLSNEIRWGVYSQGIIFRQDTSSSGTSIGTAKFRVRLVLVG